MSASPHDDPRLTAYALGELTGEERAEIERLIAGDAAARAEVERIGELSTTLGSELGKELATAAAPALTSAQRGAILRAATPRAARPLRWGWRASVVGAALAAGLLVTVTVAQLQRDAPSAAGPVVDAPQQLARREAPSADDAAAAPAAAPAEPLASSFGDVARDAEPHPQAVASTAAPGVATPTKADTAAASVAAKDSASRIAATAPAPATPAPAIARAPADAAPPASAPAPPSAPPRPMVQPMVQKERESAALLRHGATARRYAQPGSSGLAAGAGAPVVPPAAIEKPSAAEETRSVALAAAPAGALIPEGTPASAHDGSFHLVAQAPLSSFPLATGSDPYPAISAAITHGRLPSPDDVRIAALIDHFRTHDAGQPPRGAPVALAVEIAPCPWNAAHWLARIGVVGDPTKTGWQRDAVAEVEFNQACVHSYRRIGEEDAVGAPAPAADGPAAEAPSSASTINALYELVPASPAQASGATGTGEVLTVTAYYRGIGAAVDHLAASVALAQVRGEPSADLRFLGAVAGFGMALRHAPDQRPSWELILRDARTALGADPQAQRREFVALVERAMVLDRR